MRRRDWRRVRAGLARLAALAAGAGLALAGCGAGRKPVDLAFRPAAGDALRLEQAAREEIFRDQDGKEPGIVQDTRVVAALEVRGRQADGRIAVDVVWESIELSIRSPSLSLRWDSREGGNAGKAGEALAALAGRRVAILVDEAGAVQAAREDAEPAAREAAGFFCPLPAGAVRPGDSWNTTLSAPAGAAAGGLSVRSRNRWTLAALSGRSATVTVVTLVEAAGGGTGPGVRGGGTGRFEVDPATGLLLLARCGQEVTVAAGSVGLPGAVRVRRTVRIQRLPAAGSRAATGPR